MSDETAHLRPEEALAALSGPENQSIPLYRHGTLVVNVYAPRGYDSQSPHSRDEIYVVIKGTGLFFNGTDRKPFKAGDLLFAAAGVLHRFEGFTDDLALWVMFYGPEGGEEKGEGRRGGLPMSK